MIVGPVPSNLVWDPVTTTTWAWSPDNPVRVSAATATVSAAETVGP